MSKIRRIYVIIVNEGYLQTQVVTMFLYMLVYAYPELIVLLIQTISLRLFVYERTIKFTDHCQQIRILRIKVLNLNHE